MDGESCAHTLDTASHRGLRLLGWCDPDGPSRRATHLQSVPDWSARGAVIDAQRANQTPGLYHAADSDDYIFQVNPGVVVPEGGSLDLRQRLFQIGDDILRMFDSHTEAYQRRRDAYGQLLVFGDVGMGHGPGVLGQ